MTDKNTPEGYSTRGGDNSFGVEGVERPAAKRLNPHQWNELLSLLKSGMYTQKELAAQYGVSTNAIAVKRKKLGGIKIGEESTVKSSLSAIDKNQMALENAIGFSSAEAARLITDAKRETFKRNEAIGKLGHMLLNSKIQDKSFNFGALKDDMKVLMDAQTLFEKQLRLTGLCLGFEDGKFDTAADAPVLTINKMTEEEIVDIRSRSIESDDDGVDDDDLLDDLDVGDYDDDTEI